MESPDIPAKTRAPLIRVLEKHKRFVSTRKHILDYPRRSWNGTWMRAPLSSTLRRIREIEVAGISAYPDWRQEAERLTAAGEAILSDNETYGAHLDRIVDAGTHMIRALSDASRGDRG